MSDDLRFWHRTLRTPVHRYVHPETGRQITVIGAMHVAEPGYYAGLRTLISELEAGGAIVQCEGSGRVPYDEQDLTDEEHTVLDMQDRTKELEKRRIAELGWERQIDDPNVTGDRPRTGYAAPPACGMTDCGTWRRIRPLRGA